MATRGTVLQPSYTRSEVPLGLPHTRFLFSHAGVYCRVSGGDRAKQTTSPPKNPEADLRTTRLRTDPPEQRASFDSCSLSSAQKLCSPL
eukprot:1089939-Rhodomonas_salina.1